MLWIICNNYGEALDGNSISIFGINHWIVKPEQSYQVRTGHAVLFKKITVSETIILIGSEHV